MEYRNENPQSVPEGSRSVVEGIIDARRKELRLTWRQVAARSGVSTETLRQVRLGEPVSDLTEAGLEDALGWPPGGMQLARAGTTPDPGPNQIPDHLTESNQRLRRVMQLARDQNAEFQRGLVDVVSRGLVRTAISVARVDEGVGATVYIDHPPGEGVTPQLLRGFADALEQMERERAERRRLGQGHDTSATLY